jgi:hypothetical protein
MLLNDLPSVNNISDDIIVYAKTKSQHDKRVFVVVKRLYESSLQTCQHFKSVKRYVSPLCGKKIFEPFFIRECNNTQVLTHLSCHGH